MLTDWWFRLRSLLRPGHVDRDLNDELAFHLEAETDHLVQRGIPRDAALRRARQALGVLPQIHDEHRDARGIALIDDLARDLRYAVRQLGRSPVYAAVAMLCLGLGIGANTAIFAVINAVMLRPLPVTNPDRLVRVSRQDAGSWSLPIYRELEARTQTLAGLTATAPTESDVDVDGESAFVAAEAVAASYGEVIGIQPALGRWFTGDREAAAVISHALWARHFGLSPDVLGRLIRSESQTYTIVGVAPRAFTGVMAPMRTDLWVPLQSRPALTVALEQRSSGQLLLFGRLHDGTTPAEAAAELRAIDADLPAWPGSPDSATAPVVVDAVRAIPNPGNQRLMGRLLTLMAAVVASVLMIACVNVGHLLLARGALRRREIAVRRSLGATRPRLLRQLLTESLVLATGGAVCGLVFATWTTALLEWSFPAVVAVFALQLDLALDWRALAFAALLGLVTTVACGVRAAWRTSRPEGGDVFKGAIGTGLSNRRPFGLVVQVTSSLVLLFVALSFLQALMRLSATDPGFAVAGRLYAHVFLPSPPFAPESRREFYTVALERLRTLPGIRHAALTSTLPLLPVGSDCAARPAGAPVPITTSAVDEGYFETMAIPIVAGRSLLNDDAATGGVVVTESLARQVWPGGTALGQRLMVGCQTPEAATVVGVARDTAVRAIGEPAEPHLYRAFGAPHAAALTTIVVETTTDPAEAGLTIRQTLLALGQGIRVYDVQSLGVHVEQSYAEVRWLTTILAAFGALALGLAAVGLYGVIAYRVTLRTPEIGLRLALGASRRDVFREVVGHGLVVVLAGVILGELVTLGLSRALGSVIEGVDQSGLSTHVVVGLAWIVVGVAACYLPAARAARIDPLAALRHD